MHAVDIWTEKSSLRKPTSIRERVLVVGHGRPLLRITPQRRDGTGYGLTVATLSGRVLLEVDITGPVDHDGDLNVLTVAKQAKYQLVKPQRRTRSR